MLRRTRSWTWLLMGFVFAWYGHSCQTSPQKTSQLDSFEVEGDAAVQSSSEKTLLSGEKKLRFVHPKKPDAWHTRRTIMLQAQPSPERILECKETAESVALNSLNIRSLDEGAISIEGKVEQSPGVYHWCFYQLMTDLDLRLERDSPLLSEKSETFLSRMRVLWVLARALDASRATDRSLYQAYLRTRYIDISQNHFGRTVEVIDAEGLLRTAGTSGKAASPYDGE